MSLGRYFWFGVLGMVLATLISSQVNKWLEEKGIGL